MHLGICETDKSELMSCHLRIVYPSCHLAKVYHLDQYFQTLASREIAKLDGRER